MSFRLKLARWVKLPSSRIVHHYFSNLMLIILKLVKHSFNSILIYNDDIGVLQPRWSGISSKIFHKSRRVDLSKKNSLSLRLCFPLQRSLRIKYVYIQFKLLFSGKIRIRLKRHLDNLFRFYRPLSTAQYYKERFEQF